MQSRKILWFVMTLSVLAGFQKSTALKEPLDNLGASLFLRIKRSALI